MMNNIEYEKCKNDIVYFADNYVKLKDHKGDIIKLYDYQKELLVDMKNNNFFQKLFARRTGKTICASILIAHFIYFNRNKTIGIVGLNIHVGKTVENYVKTILSNLNFSFENSNNRILTFRNNYQARGCHLDLVYIDEYNLIDNILELRHILLPASTKIVMLSS